MAEEKKAEATSGMKKFVVKQPYGTHQIGAIIELPEEEAKALLDQGVVEAEKPEEKPEEKA